MADEKVRATGWFTFIEGFEIELEDPSRPLWKESNRGCTRTKLKKDQLADKLNRALAGRILGWRGLTKEVLGQMFPLKQGLDLKGCLPCTDSDKIYMIERAFGFADFILDHVTDIHGFRRK